MKKSIIATLLVIFSLSVTAQQKQYTNQPLVPDNLADPTIVQFGDTYYLYATSDVGDVKSDLSISGNPVVWKSKDFVNWSFEGTILPGIDWHKYRYWAPGRVIKNKGKYYLYFTCEGPTLVAVGNTPEGPFHLANGPENFIGKEKNSAVADDIDGCPFIDDDGKGYIFWRRRKAARLTDDYLKTSGETVNIPTGWKGYSEGPQMFKRKGIYYYLYTNGGYADYQYGYVMSKKSPLGPFETPENDIILSTDLKQNIWGPGHGFVFCKNNTDEWYFVYLEYGIGGTTRQIYVSRLEFNANGTIRPVQIDNKGVGALAKIKQPKQLLLSNAVASASSARPEMTVTAHNWRNQKDLKFHLPDTLPTRQHNFEPANALDNSNYTRWWAAPDDTLKYWQVDFSEVKKIKRLEVYFVHPSLGHAFVLEKSLDGKNWQTAYEEKTQTIRSPHVAKGIGQSRFLRIRILAGEPGIWNVKLL